MKEEPTRSEALAPTDFRYALDQVSVASRIIKLGSGAGVWGLVGGFAVMTVGALGAPISLGTASLPGGPRRGR